MDKQIYIFDGIALGVYEPAENATRIVKARMKRAGIGADKYRVSIYKKSVDARKRDAVKLVYSVSVDCIDGSVKDKDSFCRLGARCVSCGELEISFGNETMRERPLVVGMGPAGMFCALILA